MSSCLLAIGAIGLGGALFACVTNTVVQRAAPDGGAAPGEAADGGTSEPVDAGPPPDRSVKGTWEKITVHPPDGDPIKELSSIFVRGPSDVYVTEGASNLGTGYYHWDGKGWTGVRYSGMATTFMGVASGDLFAYGADLFIKAKTGDAWEAFPQPQYPGGNALVYGLWGTSTDDLYASSNGGNVHWNGVGWSVVPGLDTHSGAFAGTSADDVWFTSNGYGQLAHYDGKSWTNHWNDTPAAVTKTPTDGPYGLFTSGPGDVWAMGRRRTLIHYDGSTWSIVPGPNDEWGCDLVRGWASSKKNAWLVGKGGCVFHWDGAAWEQIPSGVTDDIYGIHGSDPEHVWIAPYNTTIVLRLKPE